MKQCIFNFICQIPNSLNRKGGERLLLHTYGIYRYLDVSRREGVQNVLERGNDHTYNERYGPEGSWVGSHAKSLSRAPREREHRVREAMQSARAN